MKSDFPYKSQVLENLGVRSWINARNWSTDIGGNLLDERVLSAMNEVAGTFVDMHELIAKADARISHLCQTEEAHIATGASGAIELAVAGCIAGDDYGKWSMLPHTGGMKNEVLLARGHYINYTPQWIASGGRLVEYGVAGILKSFKKEMEAAITEKTCCISYTFSYNNVPRGIQPFEEVVELGRKYKIPVIVDAASKLPPVQNLYTYIKQGADIVCFSGGKAIGGPNNTGMMIGNGPGARIIKSIRDHTFPNHGWGRGHKLSKEQIIGFVTALEIFVAEGDTWYAHQLEVAKYLLRELEGISGLDVTLIPNDDSLHEHPMMPKVPRVLLRWNKTMGNTAAHLDAFMADQDPPVFLRNIHYYDYYTNNEWRLIDTFFVRPEEVNIILERLKRFFAR